MNFYKEHENVGETENLCPNIEQFIKAIFGEDTYYINYQLEHKNWATNEKRKNDGIIWMPSKKKLWIVEVEWKPAPYSNFIKEQVTAFARSQIDRNKLEKLLKDCIQDTMGALLKDKHIEYLIDNQNIVKDTVNNHYDDSGFFCPNIWVLLGQENNNRKTLFTHYEYDVKGYFTGNQEYIITTSRMFSNEFSYYFLLDSYFSKNCAIEIPKSILIQGKFINPKACKLQKESMNEGKEHPNNEILIAEGVSNNIIDSSGKEEWELSDFKRMTPEQRKALKAFIELKKEILTANELCKYIGITNIGGTVSFNPRKSRKEILIDHLREGKRLNPKYRDLVARAIKEIGV